MPDPGVLHEAILASQQTDQTRSGEASILPLSDGRLLLAWTEFATRAITPAWISARLSADGGRTWGRKFTLQDHRGQRDCFSPGLVRLASGDVGLQFSVLRSNADSACYWQRSADEGRTWSEPSLLTTQPGYHVINNDRVIGLRSGRLLAPLSFMPEYRADGSFVVFCQFSDDEGRTWKRSVGHIALPDRGAMEPGVVERKDGSLLMIIRTRLGDIYRAVSFDGGITWSSAQPMALIASEAPAAIKRLPTTGDLLLVWNRVFDPYQPGFGRSPLNAAISRDDGDKWFPIRDVEKERQRVFAYPSILAHGDEVLLTYHLADESGGWDFKLKILPVGWFYEPQRRET